MNSRDDCETDVSLMIVIAYVAYIFLVIGACALVTNLYANSLNPKEHIVYIDPHTMQLTIRHGNDKWIID